MNSKYTDSNIDATNNSRWRALVAVCMFSICPVSLEAQNAQSEHQFNEVILQPIPASEPVKNSEDCNCEENSRVDPISYGEPIYDPSYESEVPSYYTGFFGGMTHFDTAAQSAIGGQFGGYFAKPLTNAISLFGMANLNSFTGGTQYGGTVGLIKTGIPSQYRTDRIGGSIMFDQFTDTSVGSPYVANLRYDINYSLNSTLYGGARYSHSLTGGEVRSVVPGGGEVSIPSFDTVEGYLQGYLLGLNGQFGVGWADVIDAVSYRLSGTYTINDSLSLNSYVNYYDNGDWNSYVGFTVALGPKPKVCHSCVARNQGNRDIIRGQFGQADTVTLGELYRAMQQRESTEYEDPGSAIRFRIARRVDNLMNQLIREFGANAVVPVDLANQVVNNSVVFRAEGTGGPGSSEIFEGSLLVGPLREIRQILLSQGNELQQVADFAVLNTLQQQGVFTSVLNSTANAGMMAAGACPPGYPFRIMSAGLCFCCDNAMGTGACITCP